MADKETAVKTISADEAFDWYRNKLEEQHTSKKGPQYALFQQLTEKNGGKPPTRDQILGAVAELPQVKGHFRIEGFGDAPKQAQPPGSSSGFFSKISPGGLASALYDRGETPISKQVTGLSAKEAVDKYAGAMFTAPGPAEGLVTPGNIDLKALPPVELGNGKWGTVNSASREVNGKEVLYPTIVDGKQLSDDAAFKHAMQTGKNLGVFKDAAAADTYAQRLHSDWEAGKIPGVQMRAGDPNDKRGTMDKIGDNLARFDRAVLGEAADVADTLQTPFGIGAAVLAGPVLGTLGKVAPWILRGVETAAVGEAAYQGYDFAGNVTDFVKHPNPESAAKAIANITKAGAALGGAAGIATGKTGREKAALEEVAIQARTKLRGLLSQIDELKDTKTLNQKQRDTLTSLMEEAKDAVVQMRSPGADAAHARTMRIAQERGAEVKDPQFQPQPPGSPPKQLSAPSREPKPLPSASTGRKTGDAMTERIGRVSTPPPPGAGAPAPDVQRITTTTPKGLIEEGPSGYAPMPDSSRITRVEANRLAEKHKVAPGMLVELSQHSNEDLVKAVTEMQTLKRRIIAHPGDMLPGEPGEYLVHKQERLDQLDRFISAISDMLLYSRRPPTPPQ